MPIPKNKYRLKSLTNIYLGLEFNFLPGMSYLNLWMFSFGYWMIEIIDLNKVLHTIKYLIFIGFLSNVVPYDANTGRMAVRMDFSYR